MGTPGPRYFGKPHEAQPARLKEIIDLQWGQIGKSIHLIASACYPFQSVLHAMASPAFVFPAEGMPGSRYLPGASSMDLIETEGEALVSRLFGWPAGYRATLQPHSGTQANQIAFNAVLKQDDKVLCLKARDGGHISHTVLIGRRHETANYGLTNDGRVDYDSMRDLARKVRPKLIVVGGSALPREIDFTLCGEIARESGAYLHADISHTATFIAAGLHASTFPACDFISFNTVKNLRGPNAGILLYRDTLRAETEAAIFPTTQGGANETGMIGKFAALLEWQNRDIRTYADSIVHLSRAMASSLTAAGVDLVTGGTDCHILLMDLSNDSRTGAELELEFERHGVLLNRNLVPHDKRGPAATSGLRVGVTNLAILGYSVPDATALAQWMVGVIEGKSVDNDLIRSLQAKYRWNLDQ
ncbi:MAG: beta-eliminating lyase-related protein [Hyphomonadaceae bacterium]|nr:beta-eliminating lyase-related protein [Hyphomonadaceae bacterium]